jgi:hypothetical protein
MKTETVLLVAVIGAVALGGYYLWNKNQQNTNQTTVSIPIGNGGGISATLPTTAVAAGTAAAVNWGLNELGGLFSGGGSNGYAS